MSDISGLAETIDGGNVMDALDFPTLGATGWVELSLATVTNFDDVRGTAGADTFLFSALTGNAVVITRAGRIRFQVATAMTFCCAAADFQL